MAANRRFAAGDFGGKCERGCPPFTFGARREPRADAGAEAAGVGATPTPVASDSAINNNRIGTRRRAPKVHKGVSIPEPGAAGSRVPRPQPLLLRGLRAALAALRKPGAKRRAISGRGAHLQTHLRRTTRQSQAPPFRTARPRRSAFQAVPALLLGQQYPVHPLSVPANFKRGQKQMAANRRFAAGDFWGKCERGLPPFTINNDHSQLAAARRQRCARELRVPARSAGRFGRGAHLQTHLRRTTRQSQGAPLPDRSTSEVGVPSRPRASSWSAVRGFARFQYPRIPNGGKNKWQRTGGSLPAISGESVKGGAPLSQSTTTTRNSPPRAASGAQGSCECRREAPGGSEGGLTSKHTYDEPPARVRAPPFRTARPRRSAFQAVPALLLGQQYAVSPAFSTREFQTGAKTNGSEPEVRCRRFRGKV